LISTLAYVLGWSSLLTVKEVKITGTQSITEINSELASRELSLAAGMRLARVDVRGIKSTLSNLDWLDSYSVARNWFSGKVELTVIEKTGVAKALSQNGSTLYFDEKGELFKPVSKIQLSQQEKLALVDSEGRASEDLLGVAKLLKALPTELEFLLSNLKGISVGKSGYLKMRTRIDGRDVKINWGKADLIDQKSRVFMALLELPENKAAHNFDLSIPDSPIAS
jgi:hypothetical protein